MKSRIEIIVDGLDLNGVGLEIGPLHKPIIRKENHKVYYLDHLDTEGLKEKYKAHDKVNIERIVDIDYVLVNGSVSQSIPKGHLFDWVIASHVVEHVPDFVQYLREIGKILKPGGILALAIPDKRYCFDLAKHESTLGEVLTSFHNKQIRPDFFQVFNHFSNVTKIKAPEAWSGLTMTKPSHTMKWAYRIACESQKPGNYKDVHCWAFTLDSFTQLISNLLKLELIPFKVSKMTPTRLNHNEFFVHLTQF